MTIVPPAHSVRAMSTIIVGVENSPRSEDAIALAGTFSRAAGADVVAVNAFPYDDRPEAHFNLALRPLLRDLADTTLDRLCEALNDDPHLRRVAVADLSPARALERVADEEAAALIVVGPSHLGHIGRLHPGSTADRLLGGAPCPVALAPKGYRVHPAARIERVVVGYDGLPESAQALAAAAQIARATGAALRVVRAFAEEEAFPPVLGVPGFARVLPAAVDAEREQLERAVAELPVDAHAMAAFVEGDPVAVLTRESETADVLVVGSRGHGPLGAVLTGSVSSRLARTAACPLLIVPRGAEEPLMGLFDEVCGKLRTRAAA
jgi:nucleotide-binding universal stress UspA family protein